MTQSMPLSKDKQREIRSADGLVMQIGPFQVKIQSRIANVSRGLMTLYADFPSESAEEGFADFHIAVNPVAGLRRWYRPQVQFFFDGFRPFTPLSANQAFAFFEWGLNWCIANHAHQYLIVHAAVVEKNGLALIMPGAPGAGKSTLCAGLVARGWRLLSDELTMIPNHDSSLVVPVPRPIGLKNQSIEVMRTFAPEAIFGDVVLDTKKGSVAHIKPPKESVDRAAETATPAFLIFPRYKFQSDSQLKLRSKASSFMEIARQSFNYNVLGETGFNRLTDVVTKCDCYDFQYSNLDDAIRIMDGLVTDRVKNQHGMSV